MPPSAKSTSASRARSVDARGQGVNAPSISSCHPGARGSGHDRTGPAGDRDRRAARRNLQPHLCRTDAHLRRHAHHQLRPRRLSDGSDVRHLFLRQGVQYRGLFRRHSGPARSVSFGSRRLPPRYSPGSGRGRAQSNAPAGRALARAGERCARTVLAGYAQRQSALTFAKIEAGDVIVSVPKLLRAPSP